MSFLAKPWNNSFWSFKKKKSKMKPSFFPSFSWQPSSTVFAGSPEQQTWGRLFSMQPITNVIILSLFISFKNACHPAFGLMMSLPVCQPFWNQQRSAFGASGRCSLGCVFLSLQHGWVVQCSKKICIPLSLGSLKSNDLLSPSVSQSCRFITV